MASCCLAFWCFPCFACITSKEAGECLCLPMLDGTGCIPPISMSMRVSIRQRYGIEGTMCEDCVYSFFCLPCSWCQMSREMKNRQQPITLVTAHMRGRSELTIQDPVLPPQSGDLPVVIATNMIINTNFGQLAQPPLQQTQGLIAVHSDQWSSSICGCFDDLYICCCGFWCFPCFACSVTSKFGECCCLPVLDILSLSAQQFGLPTCGPPAVSMSIRVAARTRFGIQGDMMEDCLYSSLCNTCSWCQIAREIKRRGQNFTVINSQLTMLPGQNFMMASQPGVFSSQTMAVSSQPMMRQF
ncbi:hypothetical protein DPEC_G00104230 [Dallia pectoralis]|uniref:Uncharacterized protein n=1 Tax=Dallia pectoralis TaxID=75939 RepID=A0ACC2GXF5_DALPE|nr:hypothetical protein DPEC_G00104230 [Dallia pectoralis]